MVAESIWDDITFHPFDDLDDLQIGYANDGHTGEADAQWPSSMLVIADTNGDPIMLDPSTDGEIFLAVQGMGSWDPQPVAADINGLLKLTIAWLETSEQRGDTLHDDTDELHPESITLFRGRAAAHGVEDRHIQNVLSLR